MPTEGRSRKAVRMDDDLWEAFGTAASQFGWDRSALMRDFARWYAQQGDRATYRRRLASPEDLKVHGVEGDPSRVPPPPPARRSDH